MVSVPFDSMPSPLLPLVRTMMSPPLICSTPCTFFVPTLMPLGDEVSPLLEYRLPSVMTWMVPPFR